MCIYNILTTGIYMHFHKYTVSHAHMRTHACISTSMLIINFTTVLFYNLIWVIGVNPGGLGFVTPIFFDGAVGSP